MTTYANQVTAAYLAKRAAREAGGDPINFLTGTVVVGDGAGAVPTLSALIAAAGVTHEVWRGDVVVSCLENATNPAQIDVGVVIPAAVGGSEIGPFWIREFAIFDADGDCLVVGQMEQYKGSTGTGLPTELAFIVQIGASAADVVISSPGSALFATSIDIKNAINAHQPDCAAPLIKTDETVGGWLRRTFGLRAARQPSATGTIVAEADASGYGRPATDAEFAARHSLAGFPWPWPTLQQIGTLISEIVVPVIPGALLPLIRNTDANRYEIRTADTTHTGAGRTATAAEIAAGASDLTGNPGPAWLPPEALAGIGKTWGRGSLWFVFYTLGGYVPSPDPRGATPTGAQLAAIPSLWAGATLAGPLAAGSIGAAWTFEKVVDFSAGILVVGGDTQKVLVYRRTDG